MTDRGATVITYTWDITKTADVAQVDLFDGDGQTVNYTIGPSGWRNTRGWSAGGTVTIVNQPVRDDSGFQPWLTN